MKVTFFALALAVAGLVPSISSAAPNSVRLVCEGPRTAKPFNQFRVLVVQERAIIQYAQIASADLRIRPVFRTLESCQRDNTQADITSDSVYVECAGDGDGGVLSLKLSKDGSLKGKMQFPEGIWLDGKGALFPEDTSIRVTCKSLNY